VCAGTACDLPVVAVATNNSPICSSGDLLLGVTASGTQPFSYAWSGTGTFSPDITSASVSIANAATGDYQVTVTNTCGSTSVTIPVVVEPASAATIAYTGSPYCSNAGPVGVSRSGTPGGTYSASPGGLSLNADNGTIDPGNSDPGDYTVTYTVPATGLCPAFSTTAEVVVTSAPFASITYAGSPYCGDAGIIAVTRTGTGGGTYSASPAGLVVNPNNGNVNIGNSDPGTYTVTYTVPAAAGCPAFSTSCELVITAPPSASISYTGSPYCSNEGTVGVTRTGTGGGSYGASPTGLSLDLNSGAVNVGTSVPGTYTVTYIVDAAGGCPAFSTTAQLEITPSPSASISYAGSPYCSDAGTVSVTRTGTTGGSFSANPAGLVMGPNSGAVNISSSSPGTYTVTYTISAGGGCPTFNTTTQLVITPAPAATISYAGSPYCNTVGTAPVTRTGTGGGTYSASPSGLSMNPNNGNIHPGNSSAGTYTVTYTVPATGGCPAFTAGAGVTIEASSIWYADVDNDGSGVDADTLRACAQPDGYAAVGGDLCPNDPDKTEPGACGCGIPETNIDGDSAPDCIDGCPTDPNKIAPGVCGCGIPDTDSDGDGLADCVDNCPNLAGVVGDNCDDGDPGTEGDVITPDCVCAGTSTVGVPDVTGHGAITLMLYPNPASTGLVWLDVDGLPAGSMVRVEVLDLTGRAVAEEVLEHTAASIHHAVGLGSHVARGTYVVRVEIGGLRFLRRLVLQ
jgi:hypothetical protein